MPIKLEGVPPAPSFLCHRCFAGKAFEHISIPIYLRRCLIASAAYLPLKPMDLEVKTLKELKAETDRLLAAASKKDIHPTGDRRFRSYCVNFLNRCREAGLQVFGRLPGDESNSPAANLNEAASRAIENSPGAIETSIDTLSRNSQSQPEVSQSQPEVNQSQPEVNQSQESNNAVGTTDIQPDRSSEGALGAPLPPARRAEPSRPDGAGNRRPTERIASPQGDRVLEGKRNCSGGSQEALLCRPPELTPNLTPPTPNLTPPTPNLTPPTPNLTPPTPNITPQAPQANDRQITATFDDRPPLRGDGRRKSSLAIGMLAGRRSDRQHAGKIVGIYRTRRGIWRAKIEPPNKPNYAYFDLDNLVEQKLIYDYEMQPGGFVRTGAIFNRKRGESFEVYTRKQPPAPLINWSLEESRSLSISKLKKIAKEMGIFNIPGASNKRSLMRAILAEQAIASEGRQQKRSQLPIPNTQSPIPNPKLYYWLVEEQKNAAIALEKSGWEFHQVGAGELVFIDRYKSWEFYSVEGEPLLLATVGGATFQLDCSAIADWKQEIKKAKRAIKGAIDAVEPAAKQLSLLDLAAG